MPSIINRRPPAPRPSIISPKTGRPLVEDVLGRSLYLRLMRMLADDKRLSNDMKHEVLVRVFRRRDEINRGSKTLGDVAAEEANLLVCGH